MKPSSALAPLPTILSLRLSLRARGAPRMTRADRWRGRPAVLLYHECKDAIRRGLAPSLPRGAAGLDPASISRIEIQAVYQPPPSWSASRRAASIGGYYRQKPDPDNIAKTVLDALFSQDEQIGDLKVIRRWGEADQLTIILYPC